jgi:hypothetical protein
MPDLIDRFERSWQLIKASARVINSDGELIVLPLISGVATAIVAGFFVLQMTDSGLIEAIRQSNGEMSPEPFYVWLFVFYVVQYFIIIFFNTALVGAAIERLDGGNPTLRSALGLAFRRIGSILGYAVISATVGILLRILSERGGILGRIAAGFAGLAWTLVTFLVIPVLAAEEIGPIEAIDRSASLLKKSWGENIIGNAGISLVMSIFGAIVIAIGFGGGTLLMERNEILAVPLMVVSLFAFLVIVLIGSTLSAVYSAAVYYYAVVGQPPEGFDRHLIRDSFLPKS